MQDEVDHRLVSFFANILDERLRGQRLSQLESRQPILSEGVIEVVQDCGRALSYSAAKCICE